MEKEAIAFLLHNNYATFIDYVQTLNKAEFEKQVSNKWTPGQQTEHIYKSVKPLIIPFMLPTWLLQYQFGKANRPSKSYEALIAKYHERLQTAGTAPTRFAPQIVAFSQKEPLLQQLQKNILKLHTLILKKNEKTLDICILPHPLLGKVTLREMLYFTAYHVQHHQHSIQQIIAS